MSSYIVQEELTLKTGKMVLKVWSSTMELLYAYLDELWRLYWCQTRSLDQLGPFGIGDILKCGHTSQCKILYNKGRKWHGKQIKTESYKTCFEKVEIDEKIEPELRKGKSSLLKTLKISWITTQK